MRKDIRAAVLAGSVLLLPGAAACERPGAAPERVEVPADAEAGEVPFRLEGPGGAALVVPVHVNGAGPFDFVFDTGATVTCVDRRIAERLELEPAELGPAVGTGIGATGPVGTVRLDSVRIGAATAHELVGCVLDLSHVQRIPGLEIQGLVGLNFMRPFRVTLDFEREILRLEEP